MPQYPSLLPSRPDPGPVRELPPEGEDSWLRSLEAMLGVPVGQLLRSGRQGVSEALAAGLAALQESAPRAGSAPGASGGA